MNYRIYNTQQEAETAQRQVHYQSMLAQYNQFIDTWSEKFQTTITPEFIQQLYGASKLFLDCTLDECWEQGYNKILGFNNGKIRVDFEGVTTDFAKPVETIDGKWFIPDHELAEGGEVVTEEPEINI